MRGSLDLAHSPQSVVITLEDDIDISRGDMIVKENKKPEMGQDIEMMICWLNEKPMIQGGKYMVKHTTNDARCVIKEVPYKINIDTLEKKYDEQSVGLNEIARIKIKTTKPLYYDPYRRNRITGSIILIDEGTNNTVGAGMIV